MPATRAVAVRRHHPYGAPATHYGMGVVLQHILLIVLHIVWGVTYVIAQRKENEMLRRRNRLLVSKPGSNLGIRRWTM